MLAVVRPGAFGFAIAFLVAALLALASGLVLTEDRTKSAIQESFASGFAGPDTTADWVECAALTMQLVRSKAVIRNALETRWIRPQTHTCDDLRRMVESPPEGIPYINYAAGGLHLESVLLSFLPLSTINAVYSILSYVSIAAIFLGACYNSPRRALTIAAPITLALAFCFAMPRWANNALWAPGFFIGFFLLGIFLAIPRFFASAGNRVAFYVFLGTLIAYFDQLHGPLPVILSLLIVLNYFFYEEPHQPWHHVIGRCVLIATCFVLAFAMLTLLRLQMLALLTGDSPWPQFWGSLSARLGDSADQLPSIGITDILRALWMYRVELTGSAPASTALLASGALAWGCAVATADRESAPGLVVLALASGGILLWYAVFPNHSIVHAWLMVRMLALPAAFGFAAFFWAAKPHSRVWDMSMAGVWVTVTLACSLALVFILAGLLGVSGF